MMDAQVESDLELAYVAATNRARRVLASQYLLEECSPSSPDYPGSETSWREVWRVTVVDPRVPSDFIIGIPPTFPDRFPKVYLPIDRVAAVKQIPHLDTNRFLCGYDEETAKANADDPGGIALSILKRAVAVLHDGLIGANHADYSQELDAYWSLGCRQFGLSLIPPDIALGEVILLQLKPSWRNYSYLFASTEEAGKSWLEAVGSSSKVRAESIPFLHLKTLGSPPLPRTNGEVYQLLKSHDETNLDRLVTHLQRSERPSAILFSAPVDNVNRMLGAWWHRAIAHEVNRGPGSRRRHGGVVPGFIPNSRLAAMAELSVQNKQSELICCEVGRVDKDRLFERTLGRTTSRLEHPVNLIGSGSLGSFTAAALAQTGIGDHLRMVDPQELQPENIQRHYVGMSEIGKAKVDATKEKLCAHFPYVDCETQTQDVLELLRSSPKALSPSSLTIVTVADIAVERRLNQLFKTTSIIGDALCYMWLEPHMLAGHVVFLRRESPGCFECVFDEDLRFKHRLISNPSDFSKREAGCQSTFVPYSGLDVSEFVAQAIRFLLRSLKTHTNTVFSWIGDIEEASVIGAKLEESWRGALPFSTRTRVLEPMESCSVCGGK
jgi:Prokaryotic E2 family B/ThiF family